MPNVMIEGSNASQIIGTMGTSGTLSEEFWLNNYTLAGMFSDGAANGTLNILVSPTALFNGTNSYRPLRDNAGVAVALTLPAGSSAFRESDIHVIIPYQYVRFVSSVAQTGFSLTLAVKG